MALLFESTYNLSEIDTVAKDFLSITKTYEVWALSGDLGAGKTTFTAAIMRQLLSEDSVSSPTFSIINQYQTPQGIVYHSDWYRIGDEEEAIATGLEDMIQQPGIKIIEWWERAENLLPANTIYIYLTLIDEQSRSIKCYSTAMF